MNRFYHGNNIQNKVDQDYHGKGEEIKAFKEAYYDGFREQMLAIEAIDSESCSRKVELLNSYYDQVDRCVQNCGITSQSKFRPTVLEEFCGYLFHKLPEVNELGLGFFHKNIFAGIKIDATGRMQIDTKDVDFCIGKRYEILVEGNERRLIVPVVAIECKTYLDNTMFSEAQFTAQKLKNGTPDVRVFVLTEKNEVALDKLPSQTPVDEIFVIRKPKPQIDEVVVWDFFQEVSRTIKRVAIEDTIRLPGRLLNLEIELT